MRMRARALPFAIGALAGAVLAGLAGCAGELDPSLFPAAGVATRSVKRAAAAGGVVPRFATRLRWYLRCAARSPAVTRRIPPAGPVSISHRPAWSVASSARGRRPTSPPERLRERRQAVPGRGLEPGDGPAHGQDGRRQGDVRKHDVRARPAQFVPARLPFGLGDRCHDGSHHAMTTRSGDDARRAGGAAGAAARRRRQAGAPSARAGSAPAYRNSTVPRRSSSASR